MPVTRRLIGIEDALWQRVQDRAAADGRTLITTVGRLLRAGLAVGEPALKTAEEQLQQPRDIHGDPLFSDVMGLPARVPRDTMPPPPPPALFEGKPPSQRGKIAQAYYQRIADAEAAALPSDDAHDHGRPLSPREIERRRIARQEWARTHPEDVPQD